MQDERRVSGRWPVSVAATVFVNGVGYATNILNVNLGGCFLEGTFGVSVNDVVGISSPHNPQIDGLRAQVAWVVDDVGLKGIGVHFEPIGDTQKFAIIKWFNQMVPRPEDMPRRN